MKKAPKPYEKLSEGDHAKAFHKWLEEFRYVHTHVANEAGQAGSKNIVIMMARKKALGVSKGFPDYCVVIKHRDGWNAALYVELKKAKGARGGLNGSHVSNEQIAWGETLSKCVGTFFVFAHGSLDAQEHVRAFTEIVARFPNELDYVRYWKESLPLRLNTIKEYERYVKEE